MSGAEHKALVRRFFDEIVNGGNVAVVDEIFAPTFPGGLEPIKATASMWRTAFPDLQISIKDMIAEGDRVVARLTIRGTHQGELRSQLLGTIAPTGRQATWTGIDVFRIAGGRIAERWNERELVGLLQQLGVMERQPIT